MKFQMKIKKSIFLKSVFKIFKFQILYRGILSIHGDILWLQGGSKQGSHENDPMAETRDFPDHFDRE
jgi:hypothetical protein